MNVNKCHFLGCVAVARPDASGLCTLHFNRVHGKPDAEAPQAGGALADSNPKSAQGAKKYPLRYLPLPAAVEVNRALEDGERKYGAANWRKTGAAASVYVDACLRHLLQWYDGGQERASDSGVHNLGHAMACLAILLDAQHVGKLVDDRPLPVADSDSVLLRGGK